jgi:hypothetical protein
MRAHRLWFLVSFCGLVAGCGSGSSGGGGPTITSVTVTPATANVATGATQQFKATVAGTGSFSSQVTWAVNDVAGGNATVGTITSAGVYTAPGVPPSPNTATVKAISTEDSTKTGPATAAVLNPAPVAASLSPASVTEGSAALQVTVAGSGFNSLSSSAVGGTGLSTTFVDSGHLQVQLPAADLGSPASLAITVTNPTPGGGTSAAVAFTVESLPGGLAGPNFTAAHDATIGGEGCCTTVADFNEDGIPDVATAHFTYDIFNPTPRDEMYVQFGDGHGNFRSRVVLKTGSGPVALVPGDFNHDGHTDLVTANSPIEGVTAPPSISIFLGDGKGNFTRSDETLTLTPVSITSGDFNKDGKLDLAIGVVPSTSGATTMILLGNGDGTFKTGATLPAPGGTNVAVGDFNEDGSLDLFTCDITTSKSYLYVGKGDGTFAAAKILPIPISGPFAVADLDGDGHLDIVAAPSNPSINAIDALWGDGKGNFTVQAITAPWDFGIALGDIDGDGKTDVVLSSKGILYQTALRTFTFDGSVNDFGGDAIVADLNKDGFGDVIGYSDANIRTYLSQGAQGIVHSHITTFSNGKVVAAGDFNGDKKLDIAAATASDVTILTGDGTGEFVAGTPFGNFQGKIWGIAEGDFNGDGIPDLAVGADDIVIYQGDGKGNFTEVSRVPQVTLGSSGAIGTLLATDLNGDGKLDLVAAADSTPNITVMFGDGTGHFSIASQIALGGFSLGAASGDFNEDGHADLAITDYGSNANLARMYLGDATGKFAAGTPAGGGSGPYSIAAADFDKDGHIDLVIADFNFGTLMTMPETSIVLFGDGKGNFPRSMVLTSGSQSNGVAVADIDGDGWPDIVMMNAGNDDFYVYINDRKGSFLAPYGFGVGAAPMNFVMGDVDGDGRPDVISMIQNGIEFTLNRTVP